MAASVSPAASRFVVTANSATETSPSTRPKMRADRGETDRAQRLYLESLRTYRGVSPFPLALLDFQLGTMWMRHDRLEQARTCFEAAITLVPAYAAAQGHLAEVEADLGEGEAPIARLYPLAASSDDLDYAGATRAHSRRNGAQR